MLIYNFHFQQKLLVDQSNVPDMTSLLGDVPTTRSCNFFIKVNYNYRNFTRCLTKKLL